MTAAQGAAPWKQAFGAIIAFLLYRMANQADAAPSVVWLLLGIAALLALAAVYGICAALYRFQRLRAMQKPRGLYGRTSSPTAKDAEKLGFSFSNKDGNGIPVGGTGNRIIYWHGKGHASVRAPTEGGKTESSAAPICFALGAQRNLVVTAKGAELAILCGVHRERLGQLVIYIDPWRLMERCGLRSFDFNPVGHLVGLAVRKSAELIDKARAIAQILKPEPSESGNGENRIFRSQAVDILTWCLIFLAWLEADTGALVCNLAHLQKVLSGSYDDLIDFFEEMVRCDALEGAISRAGARFLAKIQRSGKSWESFLTEAQDAIQIFAPPSPLASSVEFSDFDPADLKKKPMSVFIITPPTKSLTHGVYAGLCLNVLIDTCIEADSFEPRVTVVADEFANLSEGKLPAILPTLYIGRSRGVQLITYVQDSTQYQRYGSEASAFTTQSEIVLAWGIRSTRDAKEYSARAGQRSIVSENGNAPIVESDGGDAGNLSVSLSEKGVPLMREDQFLHLPDFTAVLFYKQNPPLIVDLVSYRAVDPWRSEARPVPGAPPAADLPVRFKA